MADSLNDIIHAKLALHYPTMGAPASINDLINQFATDNPTFLKPLGTLTFYSAGPTETLSDAAYRWWTAYVP